MSVLEVMGTRTFASVRKHRNFRLYFCGQAVSFTGYWMQQIAAAWLLLELTDSPVAVGALALAMLLPTTVLGLFVGTVIDRFDVRRTTIAARRSSGVIALAFAVLTLGGWITVWEIYALAVSAASSPRSTARRGTRSSSRWSARRTYRTRSR